MSVESIPSQPLPIFDVPEMQDVEAKFTYNFFVADETINETGNDAINGNLSSRFLRKGTVDTTNLNARQPRYAMLTFGLKDTKKSMLATKNSSIKSSIDEIKYALSAGKIFTEDDAAGLNFSALCAGNQQLPSNIENMIRMRLNSIGTDEATPLELLTTVAETSDVDSNLLESLLPPSLNEDSESSSSYSNFFNQESKTSTLMQLNTAYAPFMRRTSAQRGTSLGMSQIVEDYLSSLKKSKAVSDNAALLSNDEYLFDIPYVDLEQVETEDFIAEADVVGFVIQKKRVYKGVRYPMPPIIAMGQKIRTVYDSQIAYGQSYEYTGHTIAKFRVPATNTEGDTFIKTFLVSSKPAPLVSITVKETRRPDPPSDVNFHFEYDKENLIITWAPPVNPQRDVKYIQVFRRKSIHDAFTLIKHFDFDDSVVRSNPKEHVDPGLDKSIITMPTYYIDSEFDKTQTYIYALVAIDARQISSNYSTQIKISFDKSKNKIKKEFVSYLGAPKQYPNWFLKQSFFVDTMKDSSHRAVQIYFNPEAYTLLKNGREVIPAFCTTSLDPLSKYVFQFINTDRLLDQKLEVTIDDSIRVDTPTKQKTTLEQDISE
jgi:hypothetical protein|tara:strand:- start:5540 stop:7339 length:1800 start_codon:yes stop_codon:yes gene_type:complete